MRGLYPLVKRAVDLTSAAAGLTALWPLLAAIAAAIRLESPGPALFRQARLGHHGREFELVKFRTMQRDATVVVTDDFTVANPKDDPRVTRVGRLLRRTSLDELPQLYNVLRGEMSLVGPRPDLPVARTLYSEQEARKLEVKPGITGYAQVSGRNEVNAHDKWAMDRYYADHAGLWLDLKILLRTLKIVSAQQGISRQGGSGVLESSRGDDND